MAAFAYSHTSKLRKGIKLAPNLTLKTGTITLSNYNAINAAIPEITGAFKIVLAVICGMETSLGYRVNWTGTSFKAWRSLTAAADTQAPDDTNVGVFDYIAVGLE